jgi:hypothetical protein
LKIWIEEGIENIYFFVHQNHEEASPLLSAYLIKKINDELGTELKVPFHPGGNEQTGLFGKK